MCGILYYFKKILCYNNLSMTVNMDLNNYVSMLYPEKVAMNTKVVKGLG